MTFLKSLNGFFQMQGFITRRDPRNPDNGSLNEGQAITLKQAVYGWTMGGAECLGFDWPEKLGSIEKGKLADFVVLSDDPTAVDPETLDRLKVLETIKEGETVFKYDKAALSDRAANPAVARLLAALGSHDKASLPSSPAAIAAICLSRTTSIEVARWKLPRLSAGTISGAVSPAFSISESNLVRRFVTTSANAVTPIRFASS